MQNRITTCIMNSWGSSVIAYFIFIAIVGTRCANDELSLIPFNERGSEQIKMQYEEFRVPSGVLLADSVHTGRNALLQENNRLMVGRYVDDQLGVVRAQAYTEFQPYLRNTKIEKNAKLVSGFLMLSFDYYRYGSSGTSKNTFTVHELTKPILTNRKNIFNSSVDFNPTAIGEAHYAVNSEHFSTQSNRIETEKQSIKIDEIDSLVIALDSTFISKLFEEAKNNTENHTGFSKFRAMFPGLTILPGNTDTKIVGFNTSNSSKKLSKSKIVLNYDVLDSKTNKEVRKQITYSLFSLNSKLLNGFTQISTDRSNTPLGGTLNRNTEFNLGGIRYYQSGGAVIPLVDFARFIAYTDTISNIMFSFVELEIKVEYPNQLNPPKALQLRILDEHNQFVSATDKRHLDSLTYIKVLSKDEWNNRIVGIKQSLTTSTNATLRLLYDESDASYRGDFTALFQTLRYAKNKVARPKRFALVAQTPWIGASVNRFWFADKSIKLKAFYALPKSTP